jgi:hypothetical protein
MPYWLMKSEPDEVSFDDVLAAPQSTVAWFGVRNYQAEHMCPYKNGQSATHCGARLFGRNVVHIPLKRNGHGVHFPVKQVVFRYYAR